MIVPQNLSSMTAKQPFSLLPPQAVVCWHDCILLSITSTQFSKIFQSNRRLILFEISIQWYLVWTYLSILCEPWCSNTYISNLKCIYVHTFVDGIAYSPYVQFWWSRVELLEQSTIRFQKKCNRLLWICGDFVFGYLNSIHFVLSKRLFWFVIPKWSFSFGD